MPPKSRQQAGLKLHDQAVLEVSRNNHQQSGKQFIQTKMLYNSNGSLGVTNDDAYYNEEEQEDEEALTEQSFRSCEFPRSIQKTPRSQSSGNSSLTSTGNSNTTTPSAGAKRKHQATAKVILANIDKDFAKQFSKNVDALISKLPCDIMKPR